MTTISERINEALERNGMKRIDLAKKTGINRSNITYYCNGEYEPKGNNLHKIAEALNVSVAWLIGADREIEEDTNEEELWELRETLRRNPEYRTLFKLAKNATTSDIKAAIAVLESLKGTRNE